MTPELIAAKKHYSFQEYLALELKHHRRYTYSDGKVSIVPDDSLKHSEIVSNLHTCIRSVFRKRGCRSFQESSKLEILANKNYVYPDVILTCNAEDVKAEYILKYPVLLAEVISPSTEKYDRTIKLSRYSRLPSLKYFSFVSQQQPFIELYSRTNSSSLFVYQAFDSMDDVIHFPDLDFQLKLEDVYAGIVFPVNENDVAGNQL